MATSTINKLTARQVNKILAQWRKLGEERHVKPNVWIRLDQEIDEFDFFHESKDNVTLTFLVHNDKIKSCHYGYFHVYILETGGLKVVLDDTSKQVLKINIPYFNRLSFAVDVIECGVDHFWWPEYS